MPLPSGALTMRSCSICSPAAFRKPKPANLWCEAFGELVEEIGIPAISEHLMNVIDKRLARGENDAIAQVLEEK